MEQARMGISGSQRGSSNIFSAINPEYRNKISMAPIESVPDADRAKRRNRLGEEGSRSWYSAINLESAVDSPETVMAKQIVEIGKIN